MDFPVGVLFNLSGFHLGIDMVMSFLLSGNMQMEVDGTEIEEDIDDWEGVRRFNIGPRISLGYAIDAGPVAIVPGAFWEMDLIDFFDMDDDISGEAGVDFSYRHMNIMGSLGIEFGM